jgi:hypothetical protein
MNCITCNYYPCACQGGLVGAGYGGGMIGGGVVGGGLGGGYVSETITSTTGYAQPGLVGGSYGIPTATTYVQPGYVQPGYVQPGYVQPGYGTTTTVISGGVGGMCVTCGQTPGICRCGPVYY